MAFESRGPVNLSLPPFRGVTRRLVLAGLIGVVVAFVLGLSPGGARAFPWIALIPAHLLYSPWSVLSYPFLPNDLLSTAFALLSVWFFAMPLEEERGPQWLLEFFLISTAGGALLACLLAALVHAPGLSALSSATGLWPFATALLLAFAYFYPNAVIRVFGILPVRARVLAAIYVGGYLLLTLVGGNRFGAALAVLTCLSGWLYLRFAGRRGVLWQASEGLYGVRNAWYRRKRQSAAKQFQVYMRKQGRDGTFDERGHFVQHDERDPQDPRWMN